MEQISGRAFLPTIQNFFWKYIAWCPDIVVFKVPIIDHLFVVRSNLAELSDHICDMLIQDF